MHSIAMATDTRVRFRPQGSQAAQGGAGKTLGLGTTPQRRFVVLVVKALLYCSAVLLLLSCIVWY